MAEKKTRYNELLGIPNNIRDPDLYQLVNLDRAAFYPEDVDTSYKSQMSKLQKIRSPKHKSFIEFLKGELRRARSTLSDERRRQAYDEELLEERRDQLARILDVVLSDGVLTYIEEERIYSVAADVGLLADETDRILDEELSDRGAERESAGTSRSAVRDGPVDPFSRGDGYFPSGPQSRVPVKPAGPDDIEREIRRRMRPTARPRRAKPPTRPVRKRKRKAPPPLPVEEEVTAELVEEAEPITAELVSEPPPPQPPSWGQKARPARTTGWGKAGLIRKAGVCAGCLGTVEEGMLESGKAERLHDGRLHCPSCTNRLIAGLVCSTCYQRITRADMKGGELVIRKGRVTHGHCAQ